VAVIYRLRRDTTLMSWRPAAVDGADLPTSQTAARSAERLVQIGQTFDAQFRAPEPGDYLLTASPPGGPPFFTQRLTFR
jgi:hypothetical protein